MSTQYTKEQLDAMSDHDITLATAKKLGLETKVYTNRHASFVEVKNKYNSWDCFEPCTNWNDVMLIAEKYGISLIYRNVNKMIPMAKFDDSNFQSNKNPRRAICEVFLMMGSE